MVIDALACGRVGWRLGRFRLLRGSGCGPSSFLRAHRRESTRPAMLAAVTALFFVAVLAASILPASCASQADLMSTPKGGTETLSEVLSPPARSNYEAGWPRPSKSRSPFTVRRATASSAHSSAPPAAPRTVLCEVVTNFQSSSGQGRSLPTATAMPLPRSRYMRGCG